MIRLQKWIAATVVVVVLLCITGAILASETKGRITILRPERNELVLSETFKDMTFQTDAGTRVLVNGRASQFADLRVGDRARVVYDRVGHVLIAIEVRVTRK